MVEVALLSFACRNDAPAQTLHDICNLMLPCGHPEHARALQLAEDSKVTIQSCVNHTFCYHLLKAIDKITSINSDEQSSLRCRCIN